MALFRSSWIFNLPACLYLHPEKGPNTAFFQDDTGHKPFLVKSAFFCILIKSEIYLLLIMEGLAADVSHKSF